MRYNISITANALRYVLPHVSSEASRPILSGVLVKETGTIAATNGKTLACHLHAATIAAPYGDSAGRALLVFQKPKAVIARNVETVSVALETGNDSATVTLFDSRGNVLGLTLATVLDPKEYPNVDHLLAGVGERVTDGGKPIPRIAIDPELFTLFSVTTGKYRSPEPCELLFSDSRSSVSVLWHRNPDAFGLIMPCQPLEASDLPSRADTVREAIAVPAEP